MLPNTSAQATCEDAAMTEHDLTPPGKQPPEASPTPTVQAAPPPARSTPQTPFDTTAGYPPVAGSLPHQWRLPTAPDPMPTEPVEYQHLLRGPRRRWWRPLAALGLALVGLVGLLLIVTVVMIGGLMATGSTIETLDAAMLDMTNPVTFATQNLLLAALIPVAGLSIWAAHRVRPGYVSSVTGRFRWGWLAWCLVVVVPIWVAYLGISVLLDGGVSGPEADGAAVTATDNWPVLLVLMALTTPFQAAGEEYLFRGWLLQNIGAWVRSRWLALGLAALVSAAGFAAAHGSPDPWIIADLIVFALAAVILTWRTGGLEAAVAIHVVNNLLALGIVIVFGGMEDAFITGETTGSPAATLSSIAATTIATAAVLWLARWRGVDRTWTPLTTSQPPLPPPPSSPSSPPTVASGVTDADTPPAARTTSDR